MMTTFTKFNSYNRLKISITQFNTINEYAICKLSIITDKEKHLDVISISLNDINFNDKKVDYIYIRKELYFMIKKARKQLKINKEYGIDVYWKWNGDNGDNGDKS